MVQISMEVKMICYDCMEKTKDIKKIEGFYRCKDCYNRVKSEQVMSKTELYE